jgi:hypothetical protein
VAFELRALINEGLQDKAASAGRAVDAAMAMEFLNAFGPPVEAAVCYRPTLTIIDPEDGHAFLGATVIGLALIRGLGPLVRLLQPIDTPAGLLGALGQWWGSTVIPSLWWSGVLVVGFAGTAWTRRRWPQTLRWKPLAGDRIHGSRFALVMGIVACPAVAQHSHAPRCHCARALVAVPAAHSNQSGTGRLRRDRVDHRRRTRLRGTFE